MRFDLISTLDFKSQEDAFNALPDSVKKQIEPKFKHDCDCCRFLGHFMAHDLYVCGKAVIARSGNNGPDYISGLLPFAETNPLLGQAKTRAQLIYGIEF